MTIEEFKQICSDELLGLSRVSCSVVERVTLLQDLSKKIASNFDIKNFGLDIQTRNNKNYILFKFESSHGLSSASGFEYNLDTFSDDMANIVLDIIDGNSAIDIINNALDDRANSIELFYIWGRSINCEVSYWDYNKIAFKLSKVALDNMLRAYRSGTKSFEITVIKLINNLQLSGDSILNIISNFNDYEINKLFQAKLDELDLSYHLCHNMISREKAIDIAKSAKSNIKIRVVDMIEQLGLFVSLSEWSIDVEAKDISISLIGDRVIDINAHDIISNYGICSRIEQFLKLKDSEKSLIFN